MTVHRLLSSSIRGAHGKVPTSERSKELLLIVLAFTIAGQPSSAEILFQSASEIRVGSAPTALAFAASEGRLIVGRDQGLALVGPLGDPFAVATRLAPIQFVKSLVLGPFTHPGALDVACVAGGDSLLYVVPGRGNREFGRPIQIPLPARPHIVRADTVDRAETRRLFVVHDLGLSVVSAAGAERRAQPITDAQFVSDLAVADLNQDQIPDLVAAATNEDALIILDGAADGTFGAPRRLPTIREPGAVLAADLDGDHRPELVVRGREGTAIHIQNPDGRYGAPTMLLNQIQRGSIAAADLDGDGRMDLAFTDSLRGIVTVLMNGGDGTFDERHSYTAGSGASALLLDDVTGDGRRDIVTVNPGGDSVTLLRGRGDGRFDGSPAIVGTTSDFTAMALADLDADSKLDIAVTSERSASLSVFLGNGQGDFADLPPLTLGGQPRALVAGDLNGDRFPDLAITDFSRDQVIILAGTDRGNFQAPERIPVEQGPVAVEIGDFQGQGLHDLVVVNTLSDSVSVLYGDGQGHFPRVERFPVAPRPTFAVVGDVNQDRHTDVVVGNDYSNTVTVLKGDGRRLAVSSTEQLAGSARAPLAEDFDRDGFIDLVVVNEDTNAVDVLPGQRGGGFGERVSVPVGHEPQSVVTGDINGDGRVDIAVLHRDPPTITILLNRSERHEEQWRQAEATPARKRRL